MQNRIEYQVPITDEERWTIIKALFQYQCGLWEDIYQTEDEEHRKECREEANSVQTLIERFYII